MSSAHYHTFHIPVMGLGYTIDTPVKVARFGISSVISIVEDHLIERMREIYCRYEKIEYTPIAPKEPDSRARRITAYLNLLDVIVSRQVDSMKKEQFSKGSDIVKYFELLPDHSTAKHLYTKMLAAPETEKAGLQRQLRELIIPGAIDVNIMTKLDKTNYNDSGDPLPAEYCDAMAVLRGFASSTLRSSVVFSAGINPRLYSYCESFNDFFPDESGFPVKGITLKVSDYRSAVIQGRFFAKKGLWVSEFRVESGLNCGGHAFATEGLLLGPILEEFKSRKQEIHDEMRALCAESLKMKGALPLSDDARISFTVQGGIGTAKEDSLLREHYEFDRTGWGSPFLLVPEVTNVDEETLGQLATAKKEDYYLSDSSPLGIPFNNFRKTTAEAQRKQRIEKNRPGSACYKKFLTFNTEFTEIPICTASRQYQDLKIKERTSGEKNQDLTDEKFADITVKDCLCEGLGAPALLRHNETPAHNLTAVTICPGPNLAYFSGTHTLAAMVQHIYGKKNLLNDLPRPHMFINEMQLYIDYLKKEIEKNIASWTPRLQKQYSSFRENLLKGVEYYRQLIPALAAEEAAQIQSFLQHLMMAEEEILAVVVGK